MRRRNKSIPIRVTEKELEEIDARASKAKKNRTEYLISAALGKEITVMGKDSLGSWPDLLRTHLNLGNDWQSGTVR